MFSIFQGQRVLKDVDQRLFASQPTFTIEQEIPKAGVTRFGKPPRLANGRKGAIHVVGFKLLPSHPTKDFRWRMTDIRACGSPHTAPQYTPQSSAVVSPRKPGSPANSPLKC